MFENWLLEVGFQVGILCEGCFGQIGWDFMGKKCKKFRFVSVRISNDVIRGLLFGGLTGNQRNLWGAVIVLKLSLPVVVH